MCEWCNDKTYSRFECNRIDDYGHTETNGNMVVSLIANFCPNCGAPLTEPKPLTVDELRERDGKTVYVPESKRYFSGYGIVDITKEIVGALDDDEGFWPFCNYGNDWQAYDRPPKEQATK